MSQAQMTCLGLMAKYWTPHSVKTRLGATIGMLQSAQIHRLFVSELGRRLQSLDCKRMAAVAPPERRPEFQQLLGDAWQTVAQSHGDLGERMKHWFVSTLTEFSYSLLIGADCPTLDSDVLCKAIDALQNNDLVLGPAVDGGYYLIGIRGPWSERFETLFVDIPWSTQHVFSITRERARAAGLSTERLQQREDVDEVDSLDRLCSMLAKSNAPQDAELLRRIQAILNQETQP